MHTVFYGGIRPEGWLRKQLEIQMQGLSGNLDKIWPDIRDSAWIGGDREGWERVPYWLDGVIPLAYLLDDADLQQRVKKYVDAIVDRQQADGWICPCEKEARSNYDIWAVFLIGKVLAQYCQYHSDERVENALYRAMKNAHEEWQAGHIRLFDWGEFRWFEGIIPLLYLYAKRPEDWMKDLARRLQAEGADYPSYTETWLRPINRWTFHTHIVNLMMMLKYEAVARELLGGEYENKAEELWHILERHNGTAAGLITGDECLAGVKNNRGTELCAVAELMYSCEWLYALTGDGTWADRLEKAAFNGYPATFTEDMWAHQYDQQANQMACIAFPGKSYFGTNGEEAHLFGLEPNYGCCTANLSQGWPKLCQHVIEGTEKGVALVHLLPVSADISLAGTRVKIRVDTMYPFRLRGDITVEVNENAGFELKIRVPGWAKGLLINGKKMRPVNGHVTIHKVWKEKETLHLEYLAAPRLVSRPGRMKTAEYGPLVFSLPVDAEYRMKEYERNGVERKFPYCDYELIPASSWNYGFASAELIVEEKEMGDIPFAQSNTPIVLRVRMAKVNWEMEEGYEWVAAAYPADRRAVTEAEEKLLIPYGCARLRMTEMPMTHK
ncbi:MAG: hypothetical protein E7324_07910 [Clostridiales bacterium]|nr:hypothetical protein [Clostridiales bacterium]